MYTEKPDLFKTSVANREASIKKQWQLLEEVIVLVKEMDQEIAESVTVGSIGAGPDELLTVAGARIADDSSIDVIGEDILKTLELSGGDVVSYEGSEKLNSATVGRLNQCWGGLLYLEETNNFSDASSHVMIYKTKPSRLPGYLQKPIPDCFDRY